MVPNTTNGAVPRPERPWAAKISQPPRSISESSDRRSRRAGPGVGRKARTGSTSIYPPGWRRTSARASDDYVKGGGTRRRAPTVTRNVSSAGSGGRLWGELRQQAVGSTAVQDAVEREQWLGL